jgi:Ras-related protein Rab-6A
MDDDQATTFLSIRYKVVFIGNPTAGKTSLLNRICNDKFLPNYDSTIGVDFFNKTIFYNESIFKLQLWDSAGQEKYRSLIPSYIRGASIIYLVYDINHHESFDAIINWLGFVTQYINKEQVKLILIGNKKDLERKVAYNEGETLAKKEGMLFFETSAKTGEGVVNMFYSSFATIDFFNDKKAEITESQIIKELIEQNNDPNKKTTQPQSSNDIASKNELIGRNNNTQTDKSKKNSLNADNIIIEVENHTNKKNPKKGCGC